MTTLEGSLLLGGNNLSKIDGLSNITSIEGTLRISNTNKLKNLDGLQNVNSITGQLIVYQAGIENIDGLSQLTSLEGTLNIDAPGLVLDLEGLLNLTQISGSLSLSRFYSLSNIDGLQNVTSITGTLKISNNNGIENLEGLSQLTTVEGNIQIYLNGSLKDIEGLRNITEINGKLEIVANHDLVDLNGLRNLSLLDGELYIDQGGVSSILPFLNLVNIDGKLTLNAMRSLSALDGLANLTTLDGSLILRSNFLTDLDDLNKLETIRGTLEISGSNTLAQINGLSNLKTLEGSLLIESNRILTNIDGLAGLAALPGNVTLIKNDLLQNIDGLQNCRSLSGSLLIEENSALRQIDGLNGLDSLHGKLEVLRNGIENINGLDQIKQISGEFLLTDNENLISINGIRSLNTIDGSVDIGYNRELVDIDGLVSLTKLNGSLIIHRNGILNLNGLRNLERFSGSLRINANPQLTDCCSLQNMLWSSDNVQLNLNYSNGLGCRNKQEVLASECDLQNISIQVYVDENNNCVRDANEVGLKNLRVRLGHQLTKSTDSAGVVQAYLLPGDYIISADLRPDLFSSCHNDFSITISKDGKVTDELPIHPIAECADLSLGMSTPFLRRCFDNEYVIEVNNSGSLVVAENVRLIIELDAFFDYRDSDMDIANNNNGFLEFNLGDIDRGDILRYKLTINLSCEAELGQAHYMTGYLVYDNPCLERQRPGDAFECRENIGSYDPNDKTIFINGIANQEIIGATDTIEYLVRFQNTGTDTAFTVRIEDELLPCLDKRSLYPFVASHDYDWWITEDRLTVLFENINLVDSTANEMGSHGFVKFRVEIDKDEVAPGDLVENSAAIYFDYNNPIITNTSVANYLCKDSYNSMVQGSFCQGDVYEWHGQVYSAPGYYTTTLKSIFGCDSLVTLYLSYVNPGLVTEIPYNGVDDDCNPSTLDDDLDQDGFLLADDCDDNNSNINPDQTEEVYNGVDEDCDPLTLDDDLDQDGFLLVDDCDDNNLSINPDAEEISNNGIDEDCDGMDLISSTYELANTPISIYPNPATDIINIAIEGQLSYVATLYDFSGRLITTEVNADHLTTTSIPDGIYIFEVKDINTGQRIVERIVISR